MASPKENDTDKCFCKFFESSETVLLVELDKRGRIIRMNPAAGRILGQMGDPQNKTFAKFVLGLDSADLNDLATRFSITGNQAQKAIELRTPNEDLGRYVFHAERVGDRLLLFGEPSRDELAKLRQEMQNLRRHFSDSMHAYGKQSLETAQARSELEEMQRQLERQALVDPLTELGNRRAFMDWVRREWARFKRYDRPLTLCIAQVDGLDALSELHSAAAAEAAFVIVSEIIASRLRESDQIARYGNREIGLLLCETRGEVACQVLSRLQMAVSQREIAPPDGSAVRLALGVAEAHADDRLPEDVLQRAAVALRRSIATDAKLVFSDGPTG